MAKSIEIILLLIGIMVFATSATGLLLYLSSDISGQINILSDNLEEKGKTDIKIVSETVPGIISDQSENETTIQIQNTGDSVINERNLFIQVDNENREILQTNVVGSEEFREDKVIEITFEGIVKRGSRIKVDLGSETAESTIETGPDEIDTIFNWVVDDLDREKIPTNLRFTTCGSTGSIGPNQSNCDSEYVGTGISELGGVKLDNGIQEFEIPRDGIYQVRSVGAGFSEDESGAVIKSDVFLSEGTKLQIAVGQKGQNDGGSGGTFVATGDDYTTSKPLIIAGGGASTDGGGPVDQRSASTSTSGNDGQGTSGGDNGQGGEGDPDDGSGGGGFLTDGTEGGGSAFVNGAIGSSIGASKGGFGGGGVAEGSGGDEPGGAGGYSGGGGADEGVPEFAGGGGSFIISGSTNAATTDGFFNTTGGEPHSTYSGSVRELYRFGIGQGESNLNLTTEGDNKQIIDKIQFENARIENDGYYITRPGLKGNQSVSVRESSDVYLETLADLTSVDSGNNPIGTFTDDEFGVAFTLRSADNKSDSVIMSTRTGPSAEGFEIYQSKSSTGLQNGIGIKITDGSEEIVVETQQDNVTTEGVDRFVVNINGKEATAWEIWKNGNELNTRVISNGDPSFNKHSRELWIGKLANSPERAMEGELSDIVFEDTLFDEDKIDSDLNQREIISTDIVVNNATLKPEFGFEPIAATEDIVVEIGIENVGTSQDEDYIVSEVFDRQIGLFGNSSLESLSAGSERTINLSHSTSLRDVGKTDTKVFAGSSENFKQLNLDELPDPGPFLNDDRADIRQNESNPNKYFGELDYNVSTRVGFKFIDADFQFVEERDNTLSGVPDGNVLTDDGFINTSEVSDSFNKGERVNVDLTVEDKAGNRKIFDLVAQVESDTLNVSNVVTNSSIIEGQELTVNVTVDNLDRELTLTENVTVEVPNLGFNKTKDNVTVGPGNSTKLTYNFQTETGDKGIQNGTAKSKRESLDFQVDIEQDVFVEFFDVYSVDYDNETVKYEFNSTSRLGRIDRVEIVHTDPSDGSVLDTYVDNTPNNESQYNNISDPISYSGLSAGQEDVEAKISVFTDDGVGDNQTILRKVDEPYIIEVDNPNSEQLNGFSVDIDLNHKKEFNDNFTNIAFRQGNSNENTSEYWIEPNNLNPSTQAKAWFNMTRIRANTVENVELRYGTLYNSENFTGEEVFRHYDGFLNDTRDDWTFGRELIGSSSGFEWQPPNSRLKTNASGSGIFTTYDETDNDDLLENKGFVSEIASRTQGSGGGVAPAILQEDINNNTLENPSFESGSGSTVENWTTSTGASRTSLESRNGSSSIIKDGTNIDDTYGTEFETQSPFGVLGGSEYKFGGHYLVDIGQDDTSQYQYRFTVEWLDENNNLVATDSQTNSYNPSDNETFTRSSVVEDQVDIVADNLRITGTGTYQVQTSLDKIGYIEFTNYQKSRQRDFRYSSGTNAGCGTNGNQNARSYGVAVPNGSEPKERSLSMMRNSDGTNGHRIITSTDSIIKHAYVDTNGNICDSGNARFEANLVSIDGDGQFTLEVTDFQTNENEVLMFRAYDLGSTGNADVGFMNIQNTGIQDETVGFDPDMVQSFAGQQVTSKDLDTQLLGEAQGLSRGFANLNTGTQYSVSTTSNSSSTDQHRSSVFEDRIINNRYVDQDANLLGNLTASVSAGPSDGFSLNVQEFNFPTTENVLYSAIDLPQNANLDLDHEEIRSDSQTISRTLPDQSRIEYISTISAQRVGSINTEYVSSSSGCGNNIGMSEGWWSYNESRGQHSVGLGRTSASMNTHILTTSDQYILDNIYMTDNANVCGNLQLELANVDSNTFDITVDDYYVDETIPFMIVYNDANKVLFEAPQNAEKANFIVESREDVGSQDADIYWDDMFVESVDDHYNVLSSVATATGGSNGATQGDALVGFNETAFENDNIRGSEIINFGSQVDAQGSNFITTGMRYDGNRTIETTYEGNLQSQTFTEQSDIRVDRVGLSSYDNSLSAFYEWWRVRKFADQEPTTTLINP